MKILEFRIREAGLQFAFFELHGEHGNLFRILHGQSAEKERIDHAEDGSVCADAESERQDCDGSEAGGLAEHASSEAQILPTGRHKRFPAGRAHDFLRDFEAPSLQAYCPKRILAAHPLRHLFVGGHIEKATQLFVQLPFDAFLSEQRPQSV